MVTFGVVPVGIIRARVSPRQERGRRGGGNGGRDGGRRGKETQLECVEPRRRRLAEREPRREFSKRRGVGGAAAAAQRSVNFILPQLPGKRGERTSLAPRPRRPTFLRNIARGRVKREQRGLSHAGARTPRAKAESERQKRTKAEEGVSNPDWGRKALGGAIWATGLNT